MYKRITGRGPISTSYDRGFWEWWFNVRFEGGFPPKTVSGIEICEERAVGAAQEAWKRIVRFIELTEADRARNDEDEHNSWAAFHGRPEAGGWATDPADGRRKPVEVIEAAGRKPK